MVCVPEVLVIRFAPGANSSTIAGPASHDLAARAPLPTWCVPRVLGRSAYEAHEEPSRRRVSACDSEHRHRSQAPSAGLLEFRLQTALYVRPRRRAD